jgi:hypothetical protein
MQKSVCRAIVVALACSVGVVVAAQGPGVSPVQKSSSSPTEKIVVTGCLQRAEPMATGTSGVAGATSDTSTKFILSNASAKSRATPTTETAGTPSSSGASSYRLDADDSKASPHVGHKVEITGTLDSASMSGPATNPSSTSSTATSNAPKLKVDSVVMISTTCP